MKNIKLLAIMVMVICLFAILPGDKADAKSTKIIMLKEGQKYQYDINGDNKKESIEYKTQSNDDGEKGFIITINKKVKLSITKDNFYNVEFYLTDINSKDKYKEIYAHVISMDMQFSDGDFYRYDGKKLNKYSSVQDAVYSRSVNLKKEQPGNGIVIFSLENPYDIGFEGSYVIDLPFKFSKGSLSLQKKADYSLKEKWETCFNLKDVVAYTTKGGKKKAFSIKKGEYFYLQKISIENNRLNYALISNKSGKKGWIKVPQ